MASTSSSPPSGTATVAAGKSKPEPTSSSAASASDPTTGQVGDANEAQQIGNGDAAQGQAEASSSATPASKVKKEVPRSPDGIIDMEIIGQVFEMDDLEEEEDDGEGDDFGFSKGIVWNYFEQAEQTFVHMNEALARKDLPELSKLGHFLKGSSAALGIIKVKDSCERMQHYGNKRDEEAGKSLSADEALEKIRELLQEVQEEYDEAEEWLKRYYREQEGEEA